MLASGGLVDPKLGGDNYMFKPADSLQFRLVDGKPKEGMVFNVTFTDKS